MDIKKSKVGRPPGRKKTSKIEILLEPGLKEQFIKKLNDDDRNASFQIREWIIDYITTKNEATLIEEEIDA